MKNNDKRLYLALNQKMIKLQDEINTLRSTSSKEEEIKSKEVLYNKTLEQANLHWDGCELAKFFET